MNLTPSYDLNQTNQPTAYVNKYIPFALLYFFFNILFLPFGLTWTAVLGPFFYAWVLLKDKRDVLLPFLAILFPFIVVHFFSAVDLKSYVFSTLNLLMIWFFTQAVKSFLRHSDDPEKLFRWILVINFALCLMAILAYFTPLQSLFWIRQNITEGVRDFLRLKMFTYEASHYAMLFVPIFVFYFLQWVWQKNTIPGGLLLLMISLPLALSFSFGVLSSLFLAMLIVFILNFQQLARKPRVLNMTITLPVLMAALLIFLFVFYPDNVLFERVSNIFSGRDSSAEGRTEDAFRISMQILQENNSNWFGIGPGQLKFKGAAIIREYYLYYDSTSVAIPNVAAETLLLFGWVGFALRMIILVSLFFVTRVWSSHFRLILFLFMFIYQFTGSYITNPAEWVIWVIVFYGGISFAGAPALKLRRPGKKI